MGERVLVSVVMITYGHEKYIRQAIEGVLMQEGDFDLELVIANDCSPDNTDAVVQDVLSHHSNAHWIRYVRHEKNIGMMPNFIFALQQAKGNYIALCDGDDYWTDPLKLQKQVDFLEKNPDYVLCFHNTEVLSQNTGLKRKFIEKFDKLTYNGDDILLKWYIPTASMVFRKINDKNPDYMANASNGDLGLQLFLLNYGKAGLIDEIMSVYRKHEGGVMNHFNTLKYYNSYINQMNEMNLYFEKKYNLALKNKIFYAYNQIIRKKIYSSNVHQMQIYLKILTLNYKILLKNRKMFYTTTKCMLLNFRAKKNIIII